ncbi:hypothetical protein GC197_06555 [bacterium]|nr:hypothetical protein [bacterium]
MLFRFAMVALAVFLFAGSVYAMDPSAQSRELEAAIEHLQKSGAQVHRNGSYMFSAIVAGPMDDSSAVRKRQASYTLNLMGAKATRETLDAMLVLPQIDSLYLGSEFKRTNEAWDAISQLGELRHLYLIDDLNDADFPRLAQFENLKVLSIRLGRFDPRQLWYLEAMHRLESLALSIDQAPEAPYFQYLPQIPNLRHLEVTSTINLPASLDGIQQVRTLTSLEINVQHTSVHNLAVIRQLVLLDRLHLSGVQLRSDDFEALRGLPKLEHLVLYDCDLAASGKMLLPNLSHLKSLQATQTKLDDQAIESLSKLPELTDLTVRDAPLTDACLPALAKSAGLQAIELHETQITSKGAAWLEAQRPDLIIRITETATP